MGGRAVFPDTKRRDGLGPRAVDVTCVTMESDHSQFEISIHQQFARWRLCRVE